MQRIALDLNEATSSIIGTPVENFILVKDGYRRIGIDRCAIIRTADEAFFVSAEVVIGMRYDLDIFEKGLAAAVNKISGQIVIFVPNAVRGVVCQKVGQLLIAVQ